MLIKGCQEGPFGRKQVVALNPEQEEALGMQAFKEVLAQEKRRASRTARRHDSPDRRRG